MARFVTFKRGGQPGKVGINPELVTDVRSSVGSFTDIFFGEHQITVEGTYEQVIVKLAGGNDRSDGEAPQQYWLKDA